MRIESSETKGEVVSGTNVPRAFLTDFGLAKSVATGSKLTRTGEALGTPAYMSPEQARGEVSSLAAATDVWGLGCVLYETLAGRPPFEGETTAGVVAGVLTRDPPVLRRVATDLPRGLETIVRVCLAKRAGRRYRHAGALRDDLARVLAGARPVARPPGSARRRAFAGLGAAAAVAWALWLALPAGGDLGGPARQSGPADPARASDGGGLAARARALRTSDPAAAERLLADALAREPARHDWRLERGLLLWALASLDEARSEWLRIPPEVTEGPAALLYLGLEDLFHLEDGKLGTGAAGRYFQTVPATASREARLAAAASAYAHGEREVARGLLDGRAGWEAALLRGMIEAYAEGGDPTAAERELTTALAEGIGFAWVYRNRAQVRNRLGNFAGAREDCDAALRLHPRYPFAHLTRAQARARLGEQEGAVADYDAGIEAGLGGAGAIFNRGFSKELQGDAAGALGDYDQALRLDPGLVEARVHRGEIRLGRGEFAGAEGDYAELLKTHPDDRGFLTRRASARFGRGDLAGALEDHEAALRSGPPDARLLFNRGQTRLMLGDAAGAVQDCSEALRLAPDLVEALMARGMARFALGDAPAAVGDLESATRLRPAAAEPWVNLGLVLESQGRYAEAARAYSESLRLAPADARAADIESRLEACQARAR